MNQLSVCKKKHLELLNLFSKEFEQVYQNMLPSQKPHLLRLAPTIFHKWYHTALIEETMLSPANLLSLETAKNKTHTGFTLSIDKKKRGLFKYHFESIDFRLKNHPVLKDLLFIAKFCIPDSEIGENMLFLPEQANFILDHITFKDIFYLDYLTVLAQKLKLIVPLKSIYSKRLQAACDYENFFCQKPIDCLQMILESTIENTIEKITTGLSLEPSLIEKNFFISFLKSPTSTDEIFIEIYRLLHVDIEKIWQKEDITLLTPEESSILSSTFYLGILLDKCFFMPFSSYLGLLDPLYFTPCNFKNTLNNICSILLMKNDVSIELFSPCTYYCVTQLCMKLLPDANKNKMQPFSLPPLSFDCLLDALLSELKAIGTKHIFSTIEKEMEMVYTLKIWYFTDKRYWKTLEFPAAFPLDALCHEICMIFGFEDLKEYTITIQKQNKPLIKYWGLNQKKEIHSALSIPLDNLAFSPGTQITLTPMLDKKLKLVIELLKVTSGNPYIVYPRIIKQSSLITKEEKMDDIF